MSDQPHDTPRSDADQRSVADTAPGGPLRQDAAETTHVPGEDSTSGAGGPVTDDKRPGGGTDDVDADTERDVRAAEQREEHRRREERSRAQSSEESWQQENAESSLDQPSEGAS